MSRIRPFGGRSPRRWVCRRRRLLLEGEAEILEGNETEYTPTHYVDVHANVAGASADTDVAADGATAFASATSISTPTTLAEALAEATAGDVIECAAGVYISTVDPATDNTPAFASANSGTLGNEIIFYAKNPAAYNYGTPALYSEIRRTPTTVNNAALGTLPGSQYVIFDGFYANEALTKSGPNTGIFGLRGTRGSAFRRCAFDRANTYVNGYNANAVYLQTTNNCKVMDCFFNDQCTYGSQLRQAANIEIYDSKDYLLAHNEHQDFLVGHYIKENDHADPDYTTQGIQEYNHFHGGHLSIGMQQGIDNEVRYNLSHSMDPTLTNGRALEISAFIERPGNLLKDIHHNTFVIRSSNNFLRIDNESDLMNSVLQNNIIYCESGHNADLIFVEGIATGWDWSDWTLDNNCWYTVDGTLEWNDLDNSPITGITEWRTTTSQAANSITTDPEFTDAANDDYTLANNGQDALTASSTNGPIGCYVTGSEEMGPRASPTYD